jgi:triosephosphate isomerase
MADFIVMPEIDGALVGGASLKVDSFTGDCEECARGVVT